VEGQRPRRWPGEHTLSEKALEASGGDSPFDLSFCIFVLFCIVFKLAQNLLDKGLGGGAR
jgi:hypothetical protein